MGKNRGMIMKRVHFDRRLASHFSRRGFLAGAGAALAGMTIAGGLPGGTATAQRFTIDPFTLGVASGDPSPNGVVLWTRLAPDPLNGGGMPRRPFPVEWQVATDDRMREVVRRGAALAIPELAHSVHVELRGLEPAHTYWYQFKAGNALSPVGRTRTAPAAGAYVDKFNFAFASCSDWQFGFFAAYGALAQEDLDLVVHLGDYIYEYGAEAGGPRQHEGPEVGSLESYRNRHAQYKTDFNLQAAHAAFPWVVTWDDHETENNYAGDVDEEIGTPPEEFLARRANAYQAYYEHMPLRRRSLPLGPDLRLYRRLTFGDLLEFNVLDTRQYRTDQPCNDQLGPRCAGALDPSATLLGPQQEAWLNRNLATSAAKWNVLAQQVMMAQFDFFSDRIAGPGAQGYNPDQWDGYVAARNRLFEFLRQRRPSNPVVITGDIHSSWAHDLKANFDDPGSETLGTEFITTSISASFPTSFVLPVTLAAEESPHTKFFDGANRGYVRCGVSRDRWQTDFRIVPTAPNGQVLVEQAPASTLASFVVEDGQPGAQRL